MNKKVKSENLFVPQNLAIELKEKGFNDFEAFAHYESNGLVDELWRGKNRDHLSAPLWQQVIDWFRTEHHIYLKVEATDFINDWCKTYFAAMWFKYEWFKYEWFKEDGFESYEGAKEFLLKKSIELI